MRKSAQRRLGQPSRVELDRARLLEWAKRVAIFRPTAMARAVRSAVVGGVK
jgi:hypothetical protein